MKLGEVISGFVCGTFVGFMLGVAAAAGLTYWVVFTHPDDPSAGYGVGIVVIATAPLGALLGAVLGAVMNATHPRLFHVTFLPIAFMFLGLIVVYLLSQL